MIDSFRSGWDRLIDRCAEYRNNDTTVYQSKVMRGGSSNEKRGRRSTRTIVGRKLDRGNRQVRKRKGSTINKEGTQSTRLRLVGKIIRSSIKIEWIQLCSLRFPKPRLRLQTERVSSDFDGEGLFDFLSRSDGGSCLNKKNSGRRNAISIYIPVANSFTSERAFFVTKLPFRDAKFLANCDRVLLQNSPFRMVEIWLAFFAFRGH